MSVTISSKEDFDAFLVRNKRSLREFVSPSSVSWRDIAEEEFSIWENIHDTLVSKSKQPSRDVNDAAKEGDEEKTMHYNKSNSKNNSCHGNRCPVSVTYESLLSEEGIQTKLDTSFASFALSAHQHDVFPGGQRMAQCRLPGAKKRFILPLWKRTQEKTCFLPDLFRMARKTNCRLVVLLDGSREWSEDGLNDSRPFITLNDANVDSTIESECSDPNGHSVLTWMRTFLPGERVVLSNDAMQSEGAVFQSMTQEEKAYGGFRLAVLRVATWEPSKAPTARVWSTLEALMERGFSESDAAYDCQNVMLIDVCDNYFGDQNRYWGVSDRSAFLMLLDAALSAVHGTSPNSPNSPKQQGHESESNANESHHETIAQLNANFEAKHEDLQPPCDSNSNEESSTVPQIVQREECNLSKPVEAKMSGQNSPEVFVVPVTSSADLPPPPNKEDEKQESFQQLLHRAESFLKEEKNEAGVSAIKSRDNIDKDSTGDSQEKPPNNQDLGEKEDRKDDEVVYESKDVFPVGSEVSQRSEARLLVKSALDSQALKEEYLEHQKNLSSLKLAERLKKRRANKREESLANPVAQEEASSSGDREVCVAQLYWSLLSHSGNLKLTREQYLCLYTIIGDAVRKALKRK